MKDINASHFDKRVRQRLDHCSSAGQMLRVLQEEYDLEDPLGPIAKIAFIQGLRAAVRMIGPNVNVNV